MIHQMLYLTLPQTGAMMVALGQGIAGGFTPSDELSDKLQTASKHVGAPSCSSC